MVTTPDQIPEAVRIVPSQGWAPLNMRELWSYRELLYFFTWRDIKARYKQTIFGASWAIIQPFLTMVVFSLFFGKLAKVPSDGLPYPIFSYTALLPWTLFAKGLMQASNSLVSSGTTIKRVYFPRSILPMSSIFGGVVDFALAFVILIGMMLVYGIVPTVNVCWLPLLFLLTIITCLGTSFWLSALNVQFRDIRYTLPFLTQLWLFATPISYPSSLIKHPVLQAVYALNPMVGVVEGFRWALLGVDTAPGPMIIVSTLVATALFISGAYYFRRMEKTFADVV